MIYDLWIHRRYIAVNGINSLFGRYQGTILGLAWTFLPALALIIIYSVIFSKIMPVHVDTGPQTISFALYLASGLLPWMAFSELLVRGSQTLLDATPYLKKMPIKEEVFVMQASVEGFIILIIYLFIICLMALVYGHYPSPAWLMIFPLAVILCLLGFGISCFLAVLNLLFSDIGQGLGIILQIWMWMIPIIYLETVVPPDFKYMFWLNPFYPFLVGFHEIFLYNRIPGILFWVAMIGWALVFSQLGTGLLHLLHDDLRDAL